MMDEYLLTHLLTSGENLFQIYRRLIGSTIYRTRSAIYYTCLTYRNISDALARLTSDHKYFSIHIQQHQYITMNCRKKRKGSAKISISIYILYIYNQFQHSLFLSSPLINPKPQNLVIIPHSTSVRQTVSTTGLFSWC